MRDPRPMARAARRGLTAGAGMPWRPGAEASTTVASFVVAAGLDERRCSRRAGDRAVALGRATRACSPSCRTRTTRASRRRCGGPARGDRRPLMPTVSARGLGRGGRDALPGRGGGGGPPPPPSARPVRRRAPLRDVAAQRRGRLGVDVDDPFRAPCPHSSATGAASLTAAVTVRPRPSAGAHHDPRRPRSADDTAASRGAPRRRARQPAIALVAARVAGSRFSADTWPHDRTPGSPVYSAAIDEGAFERCARWLAQDPALYSSLVGTLHRPAWHERACCSASEWGHQLVT